MELEKYYKGLQWKVYNKYSIENFKGYDFIVPVFEKGIRKVYNPNINDNRDPPTKRNTLFAEFAMIDIDTENILKIIGQYGLLWTDRIRTKNNMNGDLLIRTDEEIFSLKKAWEIFKALRNNDIEELREIIKLKKYSDFMRKYFEANYVKIKNDDDISKFSLKNITIVKSALDNEGTDDFVISVGIKHEPELVITVEKNHKNDVEVLRFAAFYYLAELISDKIRNNGGVFPYYLRLSVSDNPLGYSIIPTLESNNLASVLWIQFYNVLTTNQEYKECKVCGRIFGRDERKRLRDYCSSRCKKRKNRRDYLKNLKIKFPKNNRI